VYYVRYIEFCLPALAILAGAGLTGLIRLAAVTPLRWSRPGRWRLGPLRLAWLPAVLVVAVLAALLAGPQQAIRQTAARPDNLRLASAIVAAHEQPGDVVFYLPATMHVLGTAYPAPFARLRDIARNKSAIASGTLTGTEITSPARLKSRFTDVRRVWVVTGASTYKFPKASTPTGKEKLALLAGAGMRCTEPDRPARPGHPAAQAPDDSARGVPNPLAISCSRIFLRPRCSRDITVPTGVPIISAISR
jgi:mannosyltransferase